MKKNTESAAASAAVPESAVDALRKAIDEAGDNEELKRKLEGTLAFLTGENSGAEPAEKAAPAAGEEEEEAAADAGEADDDDGGDYSSGEELSDIFTDDLLAGLTIGVVAGAALVGGGVLLHKLVSRD